MSKENAKTPAKQTQTPDAPQFEVVRKVTLPVLKKEDGKEIYVQFTSPIYRGKELKGKNSDKMEPADLAQIIDLTTGEEMTLICNAVLKGTLEEEYPNEEYVGKQFAILQSKVPGKRYKNYTIKEIKLK